MEDKFVLTVLQLRRCHGRFVAAARPAARAVPEALPIAAHISSTPCANPLGSSDVEQEHLQRGSSVAAAGARESVEMQLGRARQAVMAAFEAAGDTDAAAPDADTAAEAGAGSPGTDGVAGPNLLEDKAADAASCLASLADALEAPGLSPQLRTRFAADARALLTELARVMALYEQQLALRCAGEAAVAVAVGDAAAAAAAALQADEAAAMAMWVGGLAGLRTSRQVIAAQRAAADAKEAADAAETAHGRSVAAVDAVIAALPGVDASATATAPAAATGEPAAATTLQTGDASTAAATDLQPTVSAAAEMCVAEDTAEAGPVTASEAASLPPPQTGQTVRMAAGEVAPAADPEPYHQPAATVPADSHPADPGVSVAAAEAMAERCREAAGSPSAGAGPTASAADSAARPSSEGPPASAVDRSGGAAPSPVAAGATAPVVDFRTAGAAPVANATSPTTSVSGLDGGVSSSNSSGAPCSNARGNHGTRNSDRGSSNTHGAGSDGGNARACSVVGSGTGSGSKPTQPDDPNPPLPSCCPPAAPAACRGTALDALTHLAALGGQAAADGGLPDDALGAAVWSAAILIESTQDAVKSICIVAWADPAIRCGLMQLLSYAVRHVRDAILAAPAAHLKAWNIVLCAVLICVESAMDHGVCTYSTMAEVVWLLVCTDLPQGLARLLAAMTATAQQAALAGAANSDGDVAAGGREEVAGDVETVVQAGKRMVITCASCLIMTSVEHYQGGPTTLVTLGDQDASHQLCTALLRCKLLEHSARVVILLPVTSAASPGGDAHATSVIDAGDDYFGASTEAKIALQLNTLLQFSLRTDRRMAVWSDVLLSGPNVQYFLLLHAVSQLCAADGGTDYGLSAAGARLLPLREPRNEEADQRDAVGLRNLPVDMLFHLFLWWARNTRVRPCPDRALRAVCLRAAAAAVVSASSAAGAGGGGGGSARWQFGPPGDAVAVAMAAMKCAVARARPAAKAASAAVAAGGVAAGSTSHFRRLWALVLRTADAGVRIPPTRSVVFDYDSLQLLLDVPLPALGGLLTDEGLLPPQPGPDFAAVMDAGYVAALERIIRNKARTAANATTGSQAGTLRPVLRGVCSLLEDYRGLASLMAYGEPTQVASLLGTCFKVLASACSDGSVSIVDIAGLRFAVDEAAGVVGRWDGRGAGPADRLWWRRHGGCPEPHLGSSAGCSSGGGAGSSTPDGSASNGGTATCSGGGDGSAGGGAYGGSSDGSTSGGAPLPPLHRLSLLAAFALTRGPRILRGLEAHANGSYPPSLNFSLLHSVVALLPALLQAYLHCRTQATAGAAGGSSSGSSASASHAPGRSRGAACGTAGTATSSSAGHESGGGAASNDALRRAADSWERLLLGRLDVPGLVELAAREVVAQQNATLGWLNNQAIILAALLHLLVAFPRQGRAVLQRKVRTVSGKSLPLVDWLKKGGTVSKGEEERRHLLRLAATVVAAGGEPSAQDVALLQAGIGACGWAARLGALLPPPCFVAAALPLPLCGNPACANLEGDSEAELLRRPELATGRGGANGGGGGSCDGAGIVSYCSGACQQAHERAGQEGARGGAARAQG